MHRWTLAVVLLCTVAACSPRQEVPAEDAGETVWVVQTFSGGRQCAPREDYVPPKTRELLAGVEVEVLEVSQEELGRCMACECPTYAARHFARIRATDVDRAARAGFRRAGAPPRSEP